MKKMFSITLGLLLAGPALAITGADLHQWCSAEDPSTCTGFVLGTAASVTTLQNWKKVKRNFVCLPASITEQQLRDMVISELSARPDLFQRSASSVTLNALLKNFPCKS